MKTKQKGNRGFRTSQLFIASFGFGACMMFWTIYNAYVPLILDAKLSNLGNVVLSTTVISTLTGFIMTIDNFFGLIFQPVFGRKSDHMRSRFGKRLPYLLFGIPVCAILFVLIPIAARINGLAGILIMMLIVIIFNFVMSIWRAPCVAIMPDMVPPQYQSEGNSIVNLVTVIVSVISMSAATILGALGFKESIESGNYISIFVFGSIMSVLFLLLILTCVKWKDNRKEARETADTVTKQKESLRNLNLPADVKRSMFIMMFALFCISGALDGGNTYNTLYATKTLEMDVAKVTLLGSLAAMGSIIFAVPAGILGRKLGRRKTIFIGLTLSIATRIGLMLLPLTGSAIYVLYTIINFVFAAASMLVNINTLPIMLSIGGKERFGAFTGYYYTATFTASVVCPTVIGFLVGVTNTYNTVQLFCAIVLTAAAICIKTIKHGEAVTVEEKATLEDAANAAAKD